MRCFLFTLVALVVGISQPVLAAGAEQRATDLSREVMSPFCEGLTLHDCPSDESIALREEIETWFEDGLTRAQVLQRLEAQYGDLTAVPDDGNAWLVYGLPLIALGAGSVFVVRLARRWRTPETAGRPLTAADRRRVDEELAELSSGEGGRG